MYSVLIQDGDGTVPTQITGIYIQSSSNIRVISNTFNYSSRAVISVYTSEDCIIEGNTMLGDHGESTYYIGAIYMEQCSRCQINQNTVTNCMTAIRMKNSNSCAVSNNTITLSADSSLRLEPSMSWTISDNHFSGSSQLGVSKDTSNHTVLTGNTNGQSLSFGLGLGNCHYCIVSENEITGTYHPTGTGYGMSIVDDSSGNTVEWNSFIDNEVSALCDVTNNRFDLNYYSDYNGTDANNDLIGDTPYTIPGAAGIQDLHPRMSSDARPVVVDYTNIIIAASVLAVIVVLGVVLRKR